MTPDLSMHQAHATTIVSDMSMGELEEHLRFKGVKAYSCLPGIGNAMVLIIESDRPVSNDGRGECVLVGRCNNCLNQAHNCVCSPYIGE